jgi:hypothetical protein
MADLNPNGSTGTFNLACWIEPQDKFNIEDMNVLAENTAYLCYAYTPMLVGVHHIKTAGGVMGRPLYYFSEYMASYTWMDAGDYTVTINAGTLLYGAGNGTAFTGSVYIDGTRLATFTKELLGTEVPFTNASQRWVYTSVFLKSNDTSQEVDRYYWIGYRKVYS